MTSTCTVSYGKANHKELEEAAKGLDTPLEVFLDKYEMDTNLKELPEGVAD